MRRIILWSSIALTLSAFALSCAKADKLGDRVSALEKEVAALEESAGQLNSNALAIQMIASGSHFLKEVSRHDYGYALEFTDGTVCDVFFGAEAPTKDPLLSIGEDGQWLVSMDGGSEYLPIDGASNAFSKDGSAPQFRVRDGQWQISVDDGASWELMSGSPSEAASFFRSVVYDDAKGMMTLVLSDGREVSVSLAAPCSLDIEKYQSGDKIGYGESGRVMYHFEMDGVSEIIPRLPSGWTLGINDNWMTITVSDTVAEGEYVVVLILVSEEGLVTQMDLKFTVVSE